MQSVQSLSTSGKALSLTNQTTSMQHAVDDIADPTTVMVEKSSVSVKDVQTRADNGAEEQMGGVDDDPEQDDYDALADLEAAGERYKDTGVEEDERSIDTQSASASSSEKFFGFNLTDAMLRDLYNVYDRAKVEKTIDTATIARFSIEAVVYRWRLLIEAELADKDGLMEAAKSTLALPYDQHLESHEQSNSDKVRLSVRKVILAAMEGAKWTSDSASNDGENGDGRAAAKETVEHIHRAMSEVANSIYV